MQWIAIHEDVLGSKLRGLRKKIKCSEAEALGILTLLWLWARKNADKEGLLGNTDKEDIADAIRPSISKKLDAEAVTDALISEGWIDEDNGSFYIHDWGEWQSFWYTYLEKKEKDRIRKKAEREKKKEESAPILQPTLFQAEEELEKPEKKPPKKKEEPAKINFAEFVTMTQQEHDSLVEKFGEKFTEKCIEKLDNYKGADPKKRKYKSDYRAILSWVVDEMKKTCSNLIAPKVQQSGNPFSHYR